MLRIITYHHDLNLETSDLINHRSTSTLDPGFDISMRSSSIENLISFESLNLISFESLILITRSNFDHSINSIIHCPYNYFVAKALV